MTIVSQDYERMIENFFSSIDLNLSKEEQHYDFCKKEYEKDKIEKDTELFIFPIHDFKEKKIFCKLFDELHRHVGYIYNYLDDSLAQSIVGGNELKLNPLTYAYVEFFIPNGWCYSPISPYNFYLTLPKGLNFLIFFYETILREEAESAKEYKHRLEKQIYNKKNDMTRYEIFGPSFCLGREQH